MASPPFLGLQLPLCSPRSRTIARRRYLAREKGTTLLHPQPPNDNNTVYFSLHILGEWKGRDLLCRPCGQLSREGEVSEIVPGPWD